MTASLAYRKNEAAILRGDVPKKYTRLLPHIPGQKILEIGSAEGVLSLLLAKQGREVAALEKSIERHESAQRLRAAWGVKPSPQFIWGDIRNQLNALEGVDTLLAVRTIYYLGDGLDDVFAKAAKHIPNVVLCGNKNRANRWRQGISEETGADNYYASREGMRDVLERHGYTVVHEVTDGDEIVIGKMV